MKFVVSILMSLVALASAAGATFTQNFSTAPTNWLTWNAGAVVWNAEAGNLNVTWDSRQTNSFFYFKLPFPMDRRDSFSAEFTLRLDEVQLGIDPTKMSTFPLCVGFLNLAEATRTNYFRGSGVNAATGPRSIVEFAWFPDDGFGATVGPIIASTNNQIAYAHSFPVEFGIGETYQIKLIYDAFTQKLYAPIYQNGQLRYTIKPVDYTSQFGDFKVDAFSIHSYSDAGQSPPQFAGSLLAKGVIDDVVITVPYHPIEDLHSVAPGKFQFNGEQGRRYTLERSVDLVSWIEVTNISGINGTMQIEDPAKPAGEAFYRVRADRE